MSPMVPLISSMALGAVAQICLRHGAASRQTEAAERRSRWRWLTLWALCFAAATLLWLDALRRTDISYAYPMLGAGYILVTLLAKWLLGERITGMRWIAISIITAGVVMVGANR